VSTSPKAIKVNPRLVARAARRDGSSGLEVVAGSPLAGGASRAQLPTNG
jgi:hypothetical protein